jgi:hypothetical protein
LEEKKYEDVNTVCKLADGLAAFGLVPGRKNLTVVTNITTA